MTGLWWMLTAAWAGTCPQGKVAMDASATVCCWPGQGEVDGRCVGIPRCPEGMRTLPDRCVRDDPATRPAVDPLAPTRNVMFAGSTFSGQILYLDDVEMGRLPNAFALPAGVHAWSVRNTLGEILITGSVKVRIADGNQVVQIKRPEDDAR
jgi:hypothetical protein